VGGRVCGETGKCLHTLALARDRPAARLLVGGHDHVDEPLEEVALVRRAGAPRVFERLVRLEERPGPRQREAALV